MKNAALLAIIFGLFAVVTIFLPAVNFDMSEATKGLGAALGLGDLGDFGFDISIKSSSIVFGMDIMKEECLQFSFLATVVYALPLLGCFFIYKYNKESELEDNYLKAAMACFIIAAVGMFFLPYLANFAGEMDFEDKTDMMEYFNRGAGIIVGTLSCILAAFCTYQYKKEVAIEEARRARARAAAQKSTQQPAQQLQQPQQPMQEGRTETQLYNRM